MQSWFDASQVDCGSVPDRWVARDDDGLLHEVVGALGELRQLDQALAVGGQEGGHVDQRLTRSGRRAAASVMTMPPMLLATRIAGSSLSSSTSQMRSA